MAFTGLHVEFGYQKKGSVNPSPILGPLISSEDPVSGTATTAFAPAADVGLDPMVNIIAAADSWVSIGQSPGDPSSATTPRRLALAKVALPMFVNGGDKVRWVAA